MMVVHTPPSTDFLDALGRYNMGILLHGHWHSSKAFSHSGIGTMATPPLCFGGTDTTPRGYRLLDFEGEDVTFSLKALYGGKGRATVPERSFWAKKSWGLSGSTRPAALTVLRRLRDRRDWS